MNKTIIILALLLMSIVIIAGCGPTTDQGDSMEKDGLEGDLNGDDLNSDDVNDLDDVEVNPDELF